MESENPQKDSVVSCELNYVPLKDRLKFQLQVPVKMALFGKGISADKLR